MTSLETDVAVDPQTPKDEPHLGLPKERPVTLRLVADGQDAECNFWVGLKRPGKMTPKDILDFTRPVRELFSAAVEDGIDEAGPLLITDTTQAPPRYLYFLPQPSSNFRERAIWLGELVKTIKSWGPGNVGFYLAPELMEEDEHHDLLLSLLRELIRNSSVVGYYLMVGSYGANSMLNAAVKLRGELLADSINLYVFH